MWCVWAYNAMYNIVEEVGHDYEFQLTLQLLILSKIFLFEDAWVLETTTALSFSRWRVLKSADSVVCT